MPLSFLCTVRICFQCVYVFYDDDNRSTDGICNKWFFLLFASAPAFCSCFYLLSGFLSALYFDDDDNDDDNISYQKGFQPHFKVFLK